MSGGELNGRVALVTGAGHGIGAGIALLLAARGAKVLIGDISPAFADETTAKIKDGGGEAAAIIGDVGSRVGAFDLVKRAGEVHGRLDILIHNAGIYPHARIEELTEETLQATLSVNLAACFWLTQAALPLLERSDAARIIVTSSLGGNSTGVVGLTHYAATKAGVNGFVRNAAVELGPRGITVNSVEPGLIMTENTGRFFTDEARARMGRIIPVGRVGAPADIANAMLFLALPSSGYVTGVSIQVDGGVRLVEALGSANLRDERT